LTRRRPTGFALVALVLLLGLAGAGQSASYLHLLTARHEVCAEHGEIADVAPGTPAFVPLPSDGRPSFATSRFEVEGDHHCFATAGRRESAQAAPTAPTSAFVLAEQPAPREAAAPRPTPRAILEFAPKHSPPAA
jgi:hypothetical protein